MLHSLSALDILRLALAATAAAAAAWAHVVGNGI